MSLINQVIKLKLPESLGELRGVLETLKKYLKLSFSKHNTHNLVSSTPDEVGKLDHVLISYLIGLYLVQRLFQSHEDTTRDKLIAMFIQLLEVIKDKYIDEVGNSEGVLNLVFDQLQHRRIEGDEGNVNEKEDDNKRSDALNDKKEYTFSEVIKDDDKTRLFLNYVAVQNLKMIDGKDKDKDNVETLYGMIVDTIVILKVSLDMYPYSGADVIGSGATDLDREVSVSEVTEGNNDEDTRDTNLTAIGDTADVETENETDTQKLNIGVDTENLDNDLSNLDLPLDTDQHQEFLKELKDIENDINAMKLNERVESSLPTKSAVSSSHNLLNLFDFNNLNLSSPDINKLIEYLTGLLMSPEYGIDEFITRESHKVDEDVTEEQIQNLINEVINNDYQVSDNDLDDDDFNEVDYTYDEDTGVYLKKTEYLQEKLPGLPDSSIPAVLQPDSTPQYDIVEDKNLKIAPRNKLSEGKSTRPPIDKARLLKETQNENLLEVSIKNCKFAISSIQMDDLETAKLNLQAAMDSIDQYQKAVQS